MTIIASDTFTNTSGTQLDTHDTNWTRHGSYTATTMIISGANRARRDDASAPECLYYRDETPSSADYTVEADLYAATVDGGMGVAARIDTGANTYYWADYYSGDGDWRLAKMNAGSAALLTGTATYEQTLTQGNTYNLKLVVAGDQLSVYVDDVLRIGPLTDSSISAAGKAGLRSSAGATQTDSNNFQFDNFAWEEAGSTAKPHYYYAQQ